MGIILCDFFIILIVLMERTFQNFFTRSAVRPINFMAESEGQVDQLHRDFIDDNFGLKYTNKYAITSVF